MSLCPSVYQVEIRPFTKLKFTFHVCDITSERNVMGTDITSESYEQGMNITSERNLQGTDITCEINLQGTDSCLLARWRSQ